LTAENMFLKVIYNYVVKQVEELAIYLSLCCFCDAFVFNKIK